MLDFADRHASPALAAELEASHAAAFPKQWGEAGGTKRAAEASPGGPPAKRAATDPLQGRAGQPTSLAAPAFPPAQPAAAGSDCKRLLMWTGNALWPVMLPTLAPDLSLCSVAGQSHRTRRYPQQTQGTRTA